MLSWIIVAAVAASPALLRDSPSVLRPDRVVRVGDVIVSALPAELAQRIVLRVPEHKRTITVSRLALATLVRRVAPNLRIADGTGNILFVARDRPRVGEPGAALMARPAIAKGEAIRLVATMGPVRIERVVTALQDASGSRIFVRNEDGQVFAVRIGATRAAEAVR